MAWSALQHRRTQERQRIDHLRRQRVNNCRWLAQLDWRWSQFSLKVTQLAFSIGGSGRSHRVSSGCLRERLPHASFAESRLSQAPQNGEI